MATILRKWLLLPPYIDSNPPQGQYMVTEGSMLPESLKEK
jgi:hypothetical protein